MIIALIRHEAGNVVLVDENIYEAVARARRLGLIVMQAEVLCFTDDVLLPPEEVDDAR